MVRIALRSVPLHATRPRSGGVFANAPRPGHVAVRSRPFSSSTPGHRDVHILEVGARDGLQNIKTAIATSSKIELIKRLSKTGLQEIEATSFVPAKWVPQLADAPQVMAELLRYTAEPENSDLELPVLTPNLRGLDNAIEAGAKSVTIFASVTEPFSKSNQNCTVAEALDKAEAVAKKALARGIKVRAATSCIFSDPFAGRTDPNTVLPVVQRFLDMGCYQVSLGDTLGVGTSKNTEDLLNVLLKKVPASLLAGHFHDTYGQGISNIIRAYDMGIRTFDASVAGLGGCPYAPGAKGNVCTEDVVYTLENSGISTGVDLNQLISVGQWISEEIGIPYGSRVGAAIVAKSASR